jgi:hypothetical protein
MKAVANVLPRNFIIPEVLRCLVQDGCMYVGKIIANSTKTASSIQSLEIWFYLFGSYDNTDTSIYIYHVYIMYVMCNIIYILHYILFYYIPSFIIYSIQ